MKNICVIGARSGSKSIINKNLQSIEGKSLLRICAEKAIQSKLFDQIYVSSDEPKYEAEILNLDKINFVLRPKAISLDDSFEGDYIRHVVEKFGLSDDNNIIARMQCTSPFQSIKSMTESLKMLRQTESCDSVQIITETPTSVYKSLKFKLDSMFLEPAYQNGILGPENRQSFSKTYFRNNFYALPVSNLHNSPYLGPNCFGFVGEDRESIDIDNPFDLKVARALAKLEPEWLTE